MIRVEDALRIIMDDVDILSIEEVPLANLLDRVLAEDVYADYNIPFLDNSAMDGYAVRSSDLKDCKRDNPKILDVIYDLKAGYVTKQVVKENQAIRIMTGAPIPKGADSVIIVEETQKQGKDKVSIFREPVPGANIRKRGEDIKKGEMILQKGILLNPAHIGILASLGRQSVKVTRKPKVAILATGDEVIDIDKRIKPGKLRNSNTYTLYNQVLQSGAIPKNLGIAKDQPDELEKKIGEGFDCDLIVTSGGVSVGDYDLVKVILEKMGIDIKFWKVSMRPGKPLVFGRLGKRFVFGLPGNPVSSMISFEVFIRPTILKMLGQDFDTRKEVNAALEENVKKKKGLMYFLRAQTRWKDGVYITHTTGPQGSGILKSMSIANSLIILPEEDEYVPEGTKVTVRFLD